MKMQTGNSWSCLPCSFAMVINMPVKDFISLLGHDGGAKPYPEAPEQVAGFHEQECIEVLQALNYACTPIEMVPQMMPWLDGPMRQIWFPRVSVVPEPPSCLDLRAVGNKERFIRHLSNTCGVLTGKRIIDPRARPIGHAVAWDGQSIYDPRGDHGLIYSFYNAGEHGFSPQTFWKVQDLNG